MNTRGAQAGRPTGGCHRTRGLRDSPEYVRVGVYSGVSSKAEGYLFAVLGGLHINVVLSIGLHY